MPCEIGFVGVLHRGAEDLLEIPWEGWRVSAGVGVPTKSHSPEERVAQRYSLATLPTEVRIRFASSNPCPIPFTLCVSEP